MATENQKKIKILKDGPYEVSGNVPLSRAQYVPDTRGNSLRYEKTEKYVPQDEPYHLCRCGHSSHKPYCDGSHLKGFNGTETASHKKYDDMADYIEGKQLDLMDARELCAAARFCDTSGGTWDLVVNSESTEGKEIAVYQCENCPSGRLTAVEKNGKKIEPKLPQEINVIEDVAAQIHGPLWVKGGIEITDANGKPYPVRNRVTLCRCGKSRNKPFCDGHHMER
ncbi:MAG: CDGSH iron-sulfur domain-containing protein [Bacteroidales bacterium]|nr:CDGSH iron-sulfur domain-containing protein [Bacteroidales bacterium]